MIGGVLMKRILSKILCVFCTAILLVSMLGVSASAATASAAISASASSITVGKTFTVTIKVSSTTIGGIEGIVTYDAKVVELESGGSGGRATISKWNEAANPVSSLTVTLTFKAKAAGSSNITFTGTEITDHDFNQLNNPTATAKVTVKSEQALSANANLTSLKITAGTLSPAFSKNTLSYSVTVDNSVKEFPIYTTTEDKDAKVTVSGSKTLAVGINTRKVTVTAPSGATKTYTVNITRLAAESSGTTSVPPVSSETKPPVVETPESITVDVGDVRMEVVENFSDIDIPQGFEPAEHILNDKAVMCVKNAAGIAMFYLRSESESGFYIYDSENISFTKYTTVTIGGKAFILLNKPRNASVPTGFTATELELEGNLVTAWQHIDKELDDMYLLYLGGQHGYAGFYLYDSTEDAAVRYVDLSSGLASAPQDDDDAGEKGWFEQYTLYIVIALGVLAVALTVVLVILIARTSSRDHSEPDESDDEIAAQLSEIDFDFNDLQSISDEDLLGAATQTAEAEEE